MNDVLKIKKLLDEIENRKTIIAAERDKLRVIYSELEDLLNSFDAGIEGLENGRLEISNAIDTLSERL